MTTTDQPGASVDPVERLGRATQALLSSQLQRLRRRLLVHGLGAVIAIPVAAVLLFFVLDRTLRLPAPIRVFHTMAVLGLLAAAAWWFVRRPLRQRLQDVDVAVLIERVFPELHQQLVSAVQLEAMLQQGQLRNQSPAMVERVITTAEATSQQLPLHRVLDARATVRIWAAAAGLMTVVIAGTALAPDTAWAFFRRQLGLDVPYPKATNLVVELPPDGGDIKRRDLQGRVELTISSGAALHVSVLANGTVPEEVFLDVTGQSGETRSLGMSKRPGGRFRYVFHRLQGGFSFHARGGDDDTGDKVVHVRTVLPPLVGEITAKLTPPAYTRRPEIVQKGGAIEGLTGSEVQLDVTATAAVQSAELVFLESGRRLVLKPVAIQDDSAKAQLLRAAFRLENTDRYQVELVGDNGLKSPNPGTYPVAALQDYAPVGRWLQPDEEYGLMLLPEAVLALRIDAQDDYGLHAVTFAVESSGGTSTVPLLQPPEPSGAAPPVRLGPVELYQVKDLLGERRAGAEGLSLSIELRDNRVPEANVTVLPRRQVQIVDQSQLAAAIARQFRSIRETVGQTLEVQRERRERLADLGSRLPSATGQEVAQVLTNVEVGQGRVGSGCERIHRQLMGAFDLHLWNRLEPAEAAATVLELYRVWHRQQPDAPPNAPGFYRELASRRSAQTLGAMATTLDPILAMVLQADSLHGELSPQSLRLLTQAQVAGNGRDLAGTVGEVVKLQDRIVEVLKDLLGRLDEWNEMQDLIQDVRAMRDKQRDLQNRTDQMRGK